MAFNIKAATPDTSFPTGGFLFGADSQSATDPSIYTGETLFARFNLFADSNILEQRNSTNAQAFRLYNTYTDGSNYERGFIRYSSNVLQIGHEGAGTGSNDRSIAFRTSGFSALELSNSFATFNVNLLLTGSSLVSPVNITGQSGYTEVVEMTAPAAPSSDRVRIYAEDNGSGKTRLMARFATGAAQQIAIEP